ncbi:hypothetical protein GCM10007935_17920 [Hydrogenophaga electricum]|uniref:Uncharacterized protein n=1 Tax=Hydrogenophaga electricum TaxID=1230953 RepID=A0ABQ6C7R7_9BURK|nr:hypothetical protein GCM10007935_17920 [Hydrogenophaga electricum]
MQPFADAWQLLKVPRSAASQDDACHDMTWHGRVAVAAGIGLRNLTGSGEPEVVGPGLPFTGSAWADEGPLMAPDTHASGAPLAKAAESRRPQNG